MPDPELVAAITGLAGLLALVLGWIRWLRPRVRRFTRRVSHVLDVLGGRPEYVDEVTGITLPAVRPLHEEIQAIKHTQEAQAVALARMAEVQANQNELTRIAADHEARILSLEDIDAERARSIEESAAMWRAIADRNVIDVDEERS